MTATPRNWTRFRPGLCRSCWAACCHGWPVEASVPDMVRLGYLTREEASASLPEAAQRLKRDGIVLLFRPRAFTFVLARKRNGDCVFLNRKRRCTVYENRPEICRQFPKIGPKPGYCPYEAK